MGTSKKRIPLPDMSDKELERSISRCASRMTDLKYQLDCAKSDAAMTGEYSDPVWFRDTTYSLRKCGQFHQKALMELGKRKRSSRNKVSDSFVTLCRARLDSDIFDEIMREAIELSRGIE